MIVSRSKLYSARQCIAAYMALATLLHACIMNISKLLIEWKSTYDCRVMWTPGSRRSWSRRTQFFRIRTKFRTLSCSRTTRYLHWSDWHRTL